LNEEPCTDGVVAVDDPAGRSEDIGSPLDGRAHGLLLAKQSLADQAALERTRADQTLRLDRLIRPSFSRAWNIAIIADVPVPPASDRAGRR
jgi:hypothetical protein